MNLPKQPAPRSRGVTPTSLRPAKPIRTALLPSALRQPLAPQCDASRPTPPPSTAHQPPAPRANANWADATPASPLPTNPTNPTPPHPQPTHPAAIRCSPTPHTSQPGAGQAYAARPAVTCARPRLRFPRHTQLSTRGGPPVGPSGSASCGRAERDRQASSRSSIGWGNASAFAKLLKVLIMTHHTTHLPPHAVAMPRELPFPLPTQCLPAPAIPHTPPTMPPPSPANCRTAAHTNLPQAYASQSQLTQSHPMRRKPMRP
jgi:hypothetical protein